MISKGMKGEAVRVPVSIAATPKVVFRCLTDPTLLGRWLGAQVDGASVVGSELRIAFSSCDVIVIGGVLERVENRRLVMSWGIASGPGRDRMPAGSTLVTFDLEPVGDGSTNLTVTHANLSVQDARDHEVGWREYTYALREVATSETAARPPTRAD